MTVCYVDILSLPIFLPAVLGKGRIRQEVRQDQMRERHVQQDLLAGLVDVIAETGTVFREAYHSLSSLVTPISTGVG